MSTDNTVNSLASSFVAMAHAFEELPKVQAELEATRHLANTNAATVAAREESILRLKAELETAHAATRKAEAERDTAEQMFLETDDKLGAFTRLVQGFQADVSGLVKAAESKPSIEVEVVKDSGWIYPVPTDAEIAAAKAAMDPGPAIGSVSTFGEASNIDSVSTGPSAVDPIPQPSLNTSASLDGSMVTDAPTADASSKGVSVPVDPTPTANIVVADTAITIEVAPDPSKAGEVTPSAVDPTASSVAGDGHSPETATPILNVPQADASSLDPASVDDVGYHNEPSVGHGDASHWDAWNAWADRMSARYGQVWPARPATA